ncbi:MAG: hypothetical protein HGB29_01335 [Chlorobiaceae bacterium]|nr:hypothetical protein [Chlorobiaceae bacterium]NTW73490.1 hypothetical protein [Chlorobiaceae bacterium]
MQKRFLLLSVALLAMLLCSAVSFAGTVNGTGRQSRGYPGHNAEIHGQLFTLPATGTISNIEPNGASGFWIETESGTLVKNFDSVGQARGYSIPAGSYRIIPNIRDGVNSCSINVTITY